MANFTEQFAALTIATANANGKIVDEEIKQIYSLADGLDINLAELKAAVEKEIKNPSTIEDAAKMVINADDKTVIMESCVIVAVADNCLDVKEVNVLTKVCNALNLSVDKMVLAIASVAQNNRNIKIAGNDSDFDKDEIIIDD